MAGTIPGFSLTPQFDQFGKPAVGCRLFCVQAGTTNAPQNSYQDSGLTILNPYPLVADSTARLPQFFVADGTIKLRLTDKNGVTLFVGDNLLVVGASSGGGGGSPVDPTTVMQTGQIALRYGTGVQSGFVRANGRSIGSSISSATERANADTQALYSFLWSADPNLAVSGGRGASAAADWAANKNLALPDYRGRAIAGLDDMGNSAAGRLTASYFGTSGTVLGAAGGAESKALTQANLPSATLITTITDPGHTHSYNRPLSFGASGAGAGINGSEYSTTTGSSTTGITASTALGGSNTPHAIVQPTLLASIYIKM